MAYMTSPSLPVEAVPVAANNWSVSALTAGLRVTYNTKKMLLLQQGRCILPAEVDRVCE